MTSLLEACAAVGLSAVVMLLVSGALSSAVRIDTETIALSEKLLRRRQLEHLADRASLAAGGGPAQPPPVASVSDEDVVFAADLDGSGSVDPSSAETTALEVRNDGSSARVRIRLGRQTMTVLEAEDAEASLEVTDVHGNSAAPASASLVRLAIEPHGDAGSADERFELTLSLPGRATP